MDPLVGEILTRWTVRLAVACYMSRILIVAAGVEKRKPATSRWLWTAGCGLFVAHVACAFHFYHGWSHAAAYRHTAEQTADITGLNWGGGLYFNYAMTVVWTADVLTWWRHGVDRAAVSPRINWAVQVFFAFMMINATVVFGPPFWKWAGVFAGTGLLIAIWFRR